MMRPLCSCHGSPMVLYVRHGRTAYRCRIKHQEWNNAHAVDRELRERRKRQKDKQAELRDIADQLGDLLTTEEVQ